MSIELDNLKALIDSLEDSDSLDMAYKYSPVNPCGIIGLAVFFGRTVYLEKRDDEQISEPK